MQRVAASRRALPSRHGVRASSIDAEATIEPTTLPAAWPHARSGARHRLVTRCLGQVGAVVLAGLLVGCASAGTRPAKPAALKRPPAAVAATRPAPPRIKAPAPPAADGPALSGLPDPAEVPDAVPVPMPVEASGRPYQVNGRTYQPHTEDLPVFERGLASWYGRRFHGRRTASGETYDMHAMTAAHPTFPLPSFALVRNPANGREVVVRINDRGPFHPGRIIDLSHVAAVKLGVTGLSNVEVRRLTNDEIRTGQWRRDALPTDPGSAAEDRRLALRRTESQLAAADLTPPQEPAPVTPGAVAPVVLASASAPGPAPTHVPGPAVSVAAVASASSAHGGEPARTGPGTEPPSTPEAVVAALPSAAGHPSEPARVATVAAPGAHGAASAGGLALPVGLTGYWVQLGAFRVRDGAESFRRRVTDEMAWIAPVLSVLSETDLHRLQAGPYASRDQAHGVAQRLREALRLAPVIVERQ